MCNVTRAAVDEALPEFLGELRIERADPLGHRLHVVDEERAAGEVERHLHQRFVERNERVGEPAHAALVAERFAERVAEHDADVFDGVVQIDFEIAGRGDNQIEARVLAELLEHVVEERNAGRDLRGTRAVDHEVELDRGLLGRRASAAPSGSPDHLR